MKKLLVTLSFVLILCSMFALSVFAESGSSMDEMKEMNFSWNWDGFVNSLGFMGKGMLGIFVVTLVIIGVVAILNWHGRSLEKRNNKKENEDK